jgi:hypothetical protein
MNKDIKCRVGGSLLTTAGIGLEVASIMHGSALWFWSAIGLLLIFVGLIALTK